MTSPYSCPTRTPMTPPTSHRRPLAASLALGLAAAMLGGCETTTDPTIDAPGGAVTASFTSLYGDYLSNCRQCHTPTAPGRTSDTEDTLDFSTRATAYSTIKTGMASGLVGNQSACNGVPFVAATSGGSLLVAVLDQPTRQAIDIPQHANCDADAISDETVKVGSRPSAAFITALKTWVMNGSMDN